MAAGAALAFKLKGSRQLALCFFGEGASNEGAFHESLNLAAIWELPVIFLCENNLYAISLKLEEFVRVKNIADRAAAYGMPGVTVDGNDVVAVYEGVARAAKRAREGQGPSLVEAKTYRLAGHLFDDPQHYRSLEEVDVKWQNCPIKRFKAQLKAEGVLSEGEMERLEQEVNQEVDKAVAFARTSPFPDPEEAFQDIFS